MLTDSGEQIFSEQALAAGANVLTINVPAGATGVAVQPLPLHDGDGAGHGADGRGAQR